ncbi:MAG TPA: hypothetical protein EYP19_15075 [Desulfobacterales bacterium]|nr:hypothetical protein [Desulfobacterales bacterium]
MKKPVFSREQVDFLEDKIFNPLCAICICAEKLARRNKYAVVIQTEVSKLRKLFNELRKEASE